MSSLRKIVLSVFGLVGKSCDFLASVLWSCVWIIRSRPSFCAQLCFSCLTSSSFDHSWQDCDVSALDTSQEADPLKAIILALVAVAYVMAAVELFGSFVMPSQHLVVHRLANAIAPLRQLIEPVWRYLSYSSHRLPRFTRIELPFVAHCQH